MAGPPRSERGATKAASRPAITRTETRDAGRGRRARRPATPAAGATSGPWGPARGCGFTAPIIGVGGVRSGLDALELLAAGASAVQVGTATFNDPSAPRRVLTELESALDERGFASLTDVVGLAHDRKVTL